MCPSAHSLPGSLGAAQSEHRIVYDTSSGDIVSVVNIAAVAGAELPSPTEIDDLAIQKAARVADMPPDRLAVVTFDPTTRRPDSIHRVDPTTRELLDAAAHRDGGRGSEDGGRRAEGDAGVRAASQPQCHPDCREG